ncbi:MAG: alpha/beta hydrolase [Pseudomonadota bacterium]
MEKTINPDLFKGVPAHQLELLQRFVANHPCKRSQAGEQTIEYLSSGRGDETILFLSGAMATPYMWFHAISEFERSHRVLAPNLPPTGLTADQIIAQIIHLLDAEGIAKTHVVGYSYGGGIAQYLAEKAPDRLDKLILSHTATIRRPDAAKITQKRLDLLRPLPDITPLLRFVRSRGGKASAWWAFRNGLLRWMGGQIDKSALIKMLEQNRQFYEDIEHLPIGRVSWTGNTVVLGTKTDGDTFAYFAELCALYPDCASHIFDLPSGHHTIFLYPQAHTTILREFISGD